MEPITTVTSAYNNVTVWKTAEGFDFEVAGGTHATWSHTRVLTGYIWDALSAAVLLHPGPASKRILILGFGGGTVARQILHFLPAARITALEIDPLMLSLARTYMEVDTLNADILLGDGYSFAATAPPIYDVVLDDIFVGLETGVARPLALHEELMRKTTACLKPDGILIANMITGGATSHSVQASKLAFRTHFAKTHQIRPAKGFNVGLIGGNLQAMGSLQHYAQYLRNPLDARDWQEIRIRAF